MESFASLCEGACGYSLPSVYPTQVATPDAIYAPAVRCAAAVITRSKGKAVVSLRCAALPSTSESQEFLGRVQSQHEQVGVK